jgi:hypothetical protein
MTGGTTGWKVLTTWAFSGAGFFGASSAADFFTSFRTFVSLIMITGRGSGNKQLAVSSQQSANGELLTQKF